MLGFHINGKLERFKNENGIPIQGDIDNGGVYVGDHVEQNKTDIQRGN